MRLGKAMLSLGSLTLISRLTGFVRDQMAASFIGSGTLMDAFVIAFRLPNLFRALFAEGAFNSVFVPLFARKLEESGKEQARLMASKILSAFTLLLFVIVVVVEVFMPQVVNLIAGGQAIDHGLAVYLARIMFPYMLIVALASAGAAMMNSLTKFIAASMLPIILNLGMVVVLVFFHGYFATPAHAYAYGVIFSGIVQLLWIGYFCYKNNILPKFSWPAITPETKIFFTRLLPGLMAAGVYQINVVLSTRLASGIEGGNSWLYYADRLYQLPLGVIGIAASTALLPIISRALEAGEEKRAVATQNRALEITLILAFPCMVGLIIMGQLAISTLFERGQFSATDSLMVAKAVSAYAIGLPAAMIIRILSAGFFGRGDTQTPFYSAIFAVSIFVTCNAIFIRLLGYSHANIALASSVSIWGQAGLLWMLLDKKGLWWGSATLKSSIVKSALLAGLMGGILWLVQYYFPIDVLGFWQKLWSLLGLSFMALTIWFVGAKYLGLLKRFRS